MPAYGDTGIALFFASVRRQLSCFANDPLEHDMSATMTNFIANDADHPASDNDATSASAVWTTSSADIPDDPDFAALVCSVDVVEVTTASTQIDAKDPLVDPWLLKLANLRNWVIVLCVIAVIWVLNFAQAILIPVAMSIVMYLLLRPAVRWLQRRRIPESAGAALCLIVVGAAIVVGILPLIGPARQWLEHLPEHLRNADRKLKVIREQVGQLSEIRTRLEDLTAGNDKGRPMTVAVQQPELTNSTMMLSTTGNTLGMLLVVIVLTYFLLTSGDQLINRVLSILPTFHEKRQAVELIHEVQRGISSYLVTITVINIGLGIVVAAALWCLGVPNPGVWGLMTAIFNYVPFVGQGVTGLLIGLASLLSFDSVSYALFVPVVFYFIAAIEGNLITPALVGRHMSLNPIIVLVSLLFWGWMWGIAGAALAVPILAMTKISCDRFDGTRSIGVLLGG